jgi:hypothetical protein
MGGNGVKAASARKKKRAAPKPKLVKSRKSSVSLFARSNAMTESVPELATPSRAGRWRGGTQEDRDAIIRSVSA